MRHLIVFVLLAACSPSSQPPADDCAACVVFNHGPGSPAYCVHPSDAGEGPPCPSRCMPLCTGGTHECVQFGGPLSCCAVDGVPVAIESCVTGDAG